jgi:hypothetical protein
VKSQSYTNAQTNFGSPNPIVGGKRDSDETDSGCRKARGDFSAAWGAIPRPKFWESPDEQRIMNCEAAVRNKLSYYLRRTSLPDILPLHCAE